MSSMPGTWDPSSPSINDNLPASTAYPLERQNSHAYLQSQMLSRRREYLGTKRVAIKVGTWNVGNPSSADDCPRWLNEWFPSAAEEEEEEEEEEEGHEIYALGLQEVVDVTQTQTFLRYTDPKTAMSWRAHVQAALPSGCECIASVQLIGMLLLVFASPGLLRPAASSSVATATVGTGLMGYVGNKGGVGVRVVLGDTLRLVFVDCHLAAFANAVDRRNWDANEISRRMWFEGVGKDVVGLEEGGGVGVEGKGEGLDKADVVIWCGDVNYRIDLDNRDVRTLLQPYMPKDLPPTHADISSLIASPTFPPEDAFEVPKLPPKPTEMHPSAAATLEGTVESLFKHDQLLKVRREGKAFKGFKEGRVQFLPTYKYDVGTVGVWDSSEKARAPSWCDRVLWRMKQPPPPEEEEEKKEGTAGEDKRQRSDSMLSAILKDEILFETQDESDSEEQDLVVSRAETQLPHPPPVDQKMAQQVYDDPVSILDTPFGEVKLEQRKYISHQTITSSDHKPVSATFNLIFPAVDVDLRAKIHAEVAREVDRLENERRPVVTVVIDQPDTSSSPSTTTVAALEHGTEVVNFGGLRFLEQKKRNVIVANTGASNAKLHFVSPAGSSSRAGEAIAKPWIHIEVSEDHSTRKDPGEFHAELQPGEAVTIAITLEVTEAKHVSDLNSGTEVLDDVLILHVEDGRDVFLPVSAQWLASSYGATLEELSRIPEDVGGFRGYTALLRAGTKEQSRRALYSVPREVYRIADFLLNTLKEVVSITPDEKPWFLWPEWPFTSQSRTDSPDDGGRERRRKIEVGVWEALDTDGSLDDLNTLRVAMTQEDEDPGKGELAEATGAVFTLWLRGMRGGVIPEGLWEDIVKAGGDLKLADQVLDHLSERAGQVHANVFIYLVGIVSEAVRTLTEKRGKAAAGNTDNDEEDEVRVRVVDVFVDALVRRPGAARKVTAKEEEGRRKWLLGYVVL